MARDPKTPQLYAACERFVGEALCTDGSLFTPDHPIWTRETIDNLYDRYVSHADHSEDDFATKLQRQLQDAEQTTIQLAAELLSVYLLGPLDLKPATKRALVERVLSWLPAPLALPADMAAALADGLATFGPAVVNRDRHLKYLLAFFRHWKQLPPQARDDALSDPWTFKSVVASAQRPKDAAEIQRAALLHLVFPDTFEDTVSLADKQRIVHFYADSMGAGAPEADIDRQLLQIRRALTPTYGENFSFHSDQLKSQWKPKADKVNQEGPQAVATHASGAPSQAGVPPATQEPASTAFESICAALVSQGLHFSPELISTYLLALQTKRFVILTGISGTGKTQLALTIAKCTQPSVPVTRPADVPVGAQVIEVRPYMRAYHRMVVPATLAVGLAFPTTESGGNALPVQVSFPGGEQELRIARYEHYSATFLLFRGAFRQWFDTQLREGDRFIFELLDAVDPATFRVRFSLPQVTETREPLANYCVVAVRPDWTDNRGLLGYHNPLTGRYLVTPFLQLLLDAGHELKRAQVLGRPPVPFFAILDEMNLARVEHYFSDFLSCLESGEDVVLHDDAALEEGEDAEALAVPRRLRIPENLFFTGTVNVDETTSMFSPKVLDRAFTIECNEVDLHAYGHPLAEAAAKTARGFRLSAFPGRWDAARKPSMADWQEFSRLLDGALRALILDLHRRLEPDQLHFGYRVANEMARFVLLAAEQAGSEADALWAALDLTILAKVLPKFHGTQQELEGVLLRLFAFTLDEQAQPDKMLETPLRAWELQGGRLLPIEEKVGDGSSSVQPRLPRAAAKLWRMLQGLQRQGFTSFIT